MGCSCNCGEMEFDGAYVGTKLKYKVEITAEGFSMDRDEFEVEIRRGKQSVVIKKQDMLIHEPESGDMEYYIVVDTEALGSGKYEVITRAYVPDDDFEEGVRPEIDKQTLIVVAGV